MKKFVFIAALTAALFAGQSCSHKDEPDYNRLYANAIVTLTPTNSDGSQFSMWMEYDNPMLIAENVENFKVKKEVRALANLQKTGKKQNNYELAHVYWLDTVLTKPSIVSLGSLKEDVEKYGSDPVEIYRSWLSVAEDGYLTLNFRALWGNSDIKHSVNLVRDAENPDVYWFMHNAFKDAPLYGQDGIVAFRLSELDTPGQGIQTRKITLKWVSFTGEKSVEIDFKTRDDQARS